MPLKGSPKKKERTIGDVMRDSDSAERTKRQRQSYLSMAAVQRSLSIERAEKKQPIIDVPQSRKTQKGKEV